MLLWWFGLAWGAELGGRFPAPHAAGKPMFSPAGERQQLPFQLHRVPRGKALCQARRRESSSQGPAQGPCVPRGMVRQSRCLPLAWSCQPQVCAGRWTRALGPARGVWSFLPALCLGLGLQETWPLQAPRLRTAPAGLMGGGQGLLVGGSLLGHSWLWALWPALRSAEAAVGLWSQGEQIGVRSQPPWPGSQAESLTCLAHFSPGLHPCGLVMRLRDGVMAQCLVWAQGLHQVGS